jgi:hypothetical protein
MLLIFLFFSVILCFVCLRYVSCVPNVASVGELFISDCLSFLKDILLFERWMFRNGQPDCDDDQIIFVAMTST